jgi:hypothetical protein
MLAGQRARRIQLALLLLIAIAGVQAATPAVTWHGPWRADGFEVAVAVEVILAGSLFALRRRTRNTGPPGHPAAELRWMLRWTINLSMIAVAVLVLAGIVGTPFDNIHVNPAGGYPPEIKQRKFPPFFVERFQFGGFSRLDVNVLIYLSLVLCLVIPTVAILSLISWRRRLRLRLPQSGGPGRPGEEAATTLAVAVEAARQALRRSEAADAAIIASYLAMETSLATAGAARKATETPGELLGRAVRTGLLRSGAATRLTGLFYEARFSTHQLPGSARAEAQQALDEISAELRGPAPAGPAGIARASKPAEQA